MNHGSTEEAEQLLAELEESNHQSYLDLRNEIADGTNASETIGLLCEQMKKERIEQAQTNRGRSTSQYANQRNRSTSGNRARGAAVGPDTSKLESQIGELRRNLQGLEDENDKLRNTMREMVDDYTRQLELRDETIRKLESSAQPQYNVKQMR